jgi:hypothetical protein
VAVDVVSFTLAHKIFAVSWTVLSVGFQTCRFSDKFRLKQLGCIAENTWFALEMFRVLTPLSIF